MNETIYKNMQKHDLNLSVFATKDSAAVYLKPYDVDIRTPFFHDIDKIIYSLSYVRYMDKTQVFREGNNDHIQKRMVHVQYVSKIARTIGRALNLNEDLIEAAALGHDLGHCPYGHAGERILDKISLELGEGHFYHNVNSVRNLMYVENHGMGHNISIQVLDAILCHNGEVLNAEYHPAEKKISDFVGDYEKSYYDPEVARKLRPMTLEGCIVRISDIIAYLGRDIEDGVRMGLISYDDIPKNITNILGNNNSAIINTIVTDILENSLNKPYLKMSNAVFKAVKELKSFNYEHIYSKSLSDSELEQLEEMFRQVINKFLKDLEIHNEDSPIFKSYLNNMDKDYQTNNSNARIVLDYVSGMTDDYFHMQYANIL